jgi:hypothetical protein
MNSLHPYTIIFGQFCRRFVILKFFSQLKLLSVQFSYIFQPLYLGSTNVNYYFHLNDTQYNITEFTVRHWYLKMTKQPVASPTVCRHHHWNEPPCPTPDTDHKGPKIKGIVWPYLL